MSLTQQKHSNSLHNTIQIIDIKQFKIKKLLIDNLITSYTSKIYIIDTYLSEMNS